MADYRERDHEIFQFICCYWMDNNYSPTQAEIVEACEIAHFRYVPEALDRLEDAGLIWRERGKIRNIRVITTQTESPTGELEILEEIVESLERLKLERVR